MRLEISEPDYNAAQRLHLKWTRRRRLGWWIATAALVALGFALRTMPTLWAWRSFAFVLWFLPAWVALVTGYVRMVVLPRRLHKLYAQHKSLRRTYEFSWTDDAIRLEGENADVRLPWSDFVKWKAGPGVALLYTSDVTFQLVPRHMFADDAAWNDFLRMVASRITAAAS